MRTSLAATVGSTLLAVALTAGLAVAQSGTATDTTKDSSAPSTKTDQSTQPSQSAQPSQPVQPSQPAQPSQSSPAQVAPGSNQSNSSTDVRSESRTTERVVDTERTRILGMDSTLAVLVGAVLLIVVILAIVAMSRKQTTEPAEPTRRAL
jgi:cobalamin biosynthesis Mg chelatase CobN